MAARECKVELLDKVAGSTPIYDCLTVTEDGGLGACAATRVDSPPSRVTRSSSGKTGYKSDKIYYVNYDRAGTSTPCPTVGHLLTWRWKNVQASSAKSMSWLFLPNRFQSPCHD